MRKICIVFMLLLALGGIRASAEEASRPNLDKAGHVTLRHGRTTASISDPRDVARLREMFAAPTYEKGEPSGNWDGWEYILTWHDEEGELLEEFAVLTPACISYRNYHCNLTGAELDFQYFERLLLPYYMTEDLHPLVLALLGERIMPSDCPADWFTVEKDGRKASFTDEETIRQSIEMVKDVRVHTAWADGTVDPAGFYVLTWSSDGTNGEPFGETQFWYRAEDNIFLDGGYACTLAYGKMDTDYLESLLE